MAWFRRNKPKIEGQSEDEERKVLTEGIFVKCPECENALYKRELLESKKDQAELAMIVDLERNDLGRICEKGSVRVVEPRVRDPLRR